MRVGQADNDTGTVKWHIRKQAVVVRTVVIQKVNALALKSTAARKSSPAISLFASAERVSMRA